MFPDDVLFFNAAEHFEKDKRQNSLKPEHIQNVVATYQRRPAPGDEGHKGRDVEGCGVGAGAQVAVERVDGGHLSGGQLEPDDGDVRQQVLGVLGLADGEDSADVFVGIS